MKKSFKIGAFFTLMLLSNLSFSQVTMKKLWESDTTLTTPESILFEPKTKTVFISCINGGPAATNEKSFIAKIDLNGKVTQLKLTENLHSTKGLGFLDGKLYVTEIFKLVEIDPKTGKVLNKYEVPEAKFLNDIGVDTKNKIVYFTDMRSDRLWKLEKGQIVKVVEGEPLKNPNGVFFENGKLIVGNGDGKILAYDLQSQQFSTIAEGMGGIDGILSDGKNGYFASEWRGKVWHINTEGKTQLLLDFVDSKVNTADFEYIPSKKLMLIPTFLKNKVLAYSVE
jgi:sugar lactone lactonase YvrE